MKVLLIKIILPNAFEIQSTLQVLVSNDHDEIHEHIQEFHMTSKTNLNENQHAMQNWGPLTLVYLSENTTAVWLTGLLCHLFIYPKTGIRLHKCEVEAMRGHGGYMLGYTSYQHKCILLNQHYQIRNSEKSIINFIYQISQWETFKVYFIYNSVMCI